MRYLLYAVAGLLSFLAFVLMLAPASPVWTFVHSDVTRMAPDLRVFAVRGTVWEGEADVQFRQFPQSTLRWQLAALPLLTGAAKLDVTLDGPGLEIASSMVVDERTTDIRTLSGTIDSNYINALSTQHGFTFSGELRIQALALKLVQGTIESGSGTATWPGGRILLRTPNGMEAISLPPLDARLSSDLENLTMNVTHQREPMLNITLKPDGWAAVDLKASLFEAAALPLPEGAGADDTVLLIEEKIL